MKPNPRAKLVWVTQAMGYALPIFFVLVAAGFGLASIFGVGIVPGVDNLFVAVGLFIAVSILCAVLFYMWAQLRYKGHSFELGNDGVIISDGLIAKRYASIPFSEIAEINYDNEGVLGLAENLFGSYMVTLTTTEGKRARMHGIEDPSEFAKGLMARKYGIAPGESTSVMEASPPAQVVPEPDAVSPVDAIRPVPRIGTRPGQGYGAGEGGLEPNISQTSVSQDLAAKPPAKGQTFTILAGDVGEQAEPQDYSYSTEHDVAGQREPEPGAGQNERLVEEDGSGQRTEYQTRDSSPEERQGATDLLSELRGIRRALESLEPRK